jgi:TrmH family RNA methyltransferase
MELGGTALADFAFPEEGVMIVGSEELGTSPELLSIADSSLGRVSIPLAGSKGSLNVSVAFGIVLQSWYSHVAQRY